MTSFNAIIISWWSILWYQYRCIFLVKNYSMKKEKKNHKKKLPVLLQWNPSVAKVTVRFFKSTLICDQCINHQCLHPGRLFGLDKIIFFTPLCSFPATPTAPLLLSFLQWDVAPVAWCKPLVGILPLILRYLPSPPPLPPASPPCPPHIRRWHAASELLWLVTSTKASDHLVESFSTGGLLTQWSCFDWLTAM